MESTEKELKKTGALAKFEKIEQVLNTEDKWLEKMLLDCVADEIVATDYYANLSEKEKAVKFMLFGFGVLKIFAKSHDDVRKLDLNDMPQVMRGVIFSANNFDKIDDFSDEILQNED